MRAPARRASYREGASFNALTFLVSILLSVVSSVACSRLYGIVVIGQYALAVGAVSAVRLLSTAKERPALVRELTRLEPRHPRVTGLFAATLAFSTVLTLVVGAVAVLVSRLVLSGPVSQPGVFLPLAANVAGYAVFGNGCENLDVLASAFRAGRVLFWVRIGDGLSFVLIAVALTAISGSVWGLVIASAASQAIGLVHRLIRIRPFMRFRAARDVLRDGFATVPSLIRFGLKIAPGALADGASNESGTWLVASFSPIAAVGAYGRAYLLVKQVSVVNMYTTEMLFPTLVERHAQGDRVGYARALVDSLRYSTIAMLLFAVGAGGVATGVMHVFGPGFARGGDTLAVLLLIPALMLMSQIQRFALYSLDQPWLASVSGFLRLGVTIIAGSVLTWQFGAVGAASALVIGLIVDVAFVTRFVVRHLVTPIHELWTPAEWLSLAGAYAAGFLAARAIYGALGYPFGLFAGALAGGLIFLAVLGVTGAVNERDLGRLRDIRAMAARRRGRPAVAAPGPPAAEPAALEATAAVVATPEPVAAAVAPQPPPEPRIEVSMSDRRIGPPESVGRWRSAAVLASVSARDAVEAPLAPMLPPDDTCAPDALERAVAWLCRCQDAAGDGGVSAGWSRRRGWLPALPTAPAIETLIASGIRARDGGELLERAAALGRWGANAQAPDGAVGSGTAAAGHGPEATAGWLQGWIALHESGGLTDLAPARRAAGHLQHAPGAGAGANGDRHGAPRAPGAARTAGAGALLRWAGLDGDPGLEAAALSELSRAAEDIAPDGWPQAAAGPDAVVSTQAMADILGALLYGYAHSRDGVLLEAAERTSESLIRKLEVLGRVPGAWRPGWAPEGRAVDMASTAAVARILLDLHAVTGDPRYLNAGLKCIDFVAGRQLRAGSGPLDGGVPETFPVWAGARPWLVSSHAADRLAGALMARDRALVEAP